MKVPPKRKGNHEDSLGFYYGECLNESPSEKEGKSTTKRPGSPISRPASMKVPPKRKGNLRHVISPTFLSSSLNESPSEKEGKSFRWDSGGEFLPSLNESPSEKEGKFWVSVGYLPYIYSASMKVPPKRKGNSYPKIARNHAAETGASREPRGGYTQNYTLQPHLPPHNSLAREETMRATRHVPVTYQVLAHTKTPAGCFLSDPARVFTYERGWRGSGKPD